MALKNQSTQPDQPLKTSAEKATRQRLDAFPVRVDLRAGTPLDTRLRGNGNQGHDFGTGLPAADKAALLEYLKTL